MFFMLKMIHGYFYNDARPFWMHSEKSEIEVTRTTLKSRNKVVVATGSVVRKTLIKMSSGFWIHDKSARLSSWSKTKDGVACWHQCNDISLLFFTRIGWDGGCGTVMSKYIQFSFFFTEFIAVWDWETKNFRMLIGRVMVKEFMVRSSNAEENVKS